MFNDFHNFTCIVLYLQSTVELYFLHFYSNFLDVISRDQNERIFMFRSNLNDFPVGVLALFSLSLSVILLMKYVCVCVWVTMYTVMSVMILYYIT